MGAKRSLIRQSLASVKNSSGFLLLVRRKTIGVYTPHSPAPKTSLPEMILFWVELQSNA